MDIRPIKTEADYDSALAEIERYFDAEPQPGTPESQRFDVLASLIEHYESRAWPIDTAWVASGRLRGAGQVPRAVQEASVQAASRVAHPGRDTAAVSHRG